MVKVAFILDFPLTYNGGVNYYKNVLYAINKFNKNEVQTFLFIPADTDENLIKKFNKITNLVKTKIIQRHSLLWIFSYLFNFFLKTDFLKKYILKKYKIDLVFNCYNYSYLGNSFKIINWIPDFQSIHYPNLYSKKQLISENKILMKCLKNSDKIILSSYDSYNDLKYAYPNYSNKVDVINFVSQPHHFKSKSINDTVTYKKNTFFYLPNQFWNHKNHIIVLRALKILSLNNIYIKVVSTGSFKDFRNKNYLIKTLKSYAEINNISNYIDFLGEVPYSEVLSLINSSIAVINPSYFEGWSSTVEESKSFNKTIILSDIPVHREQNPKYARFFRPDDPVALSKIMLDIINNLPERNFSNKFLLNNLNKRTKVFSDNLTKVFKHLHNEKNI